MILAETVSIDGGVLLLILGVFLAGVVAWCFAVAVGFRAAKQAGAGDKSAMRRFVLAGIFEVALVAWTPLVVVALVLLGLQVMQYRKAKDGARGPAPGGSA